MSQIEFAHAASDYVHDLQVERGSSAGFLASGGKPRFAEIIKKRRVLVNKKKEAYKIAKSKLSVQAGSKTERFLSDIDNAIAAYEALRPLVDGQNTTVKQVLKTYTGLVELLIGSIGIAATTVDQRAIALATYRDLVWAKENAGLARANGAVLFNQSEFDPARHGKFLALTAKEGMFLREFKLFASPEALETYQKLVNKDDFKTFHEWEEILVKLSATKDRQNIAGADWFELATKRINKTKAVEDQLAQTLIDEANSYINAGYFGLIWKTTIISTVILLAFFLVIVTTRTILKPMKKIITTLPRIERGDPDLIIDKSYPERTEFAQINNAMETFATAIKEARHMESEQDKLTARSREQAKDLLRSMARIGEHNHCQWYAGYHAGNSSSERDDRTNV